jgi:hypothetical protein
MRALDQLNRRLGRDTVTMPLPALRAPGQCSAVAFRLVTLISHSWARDTPASALHDRLFNDEKITIGRSTGALSVGRMLSRGARLGAREGRGESSGILVTLNS